MYLRLIFFELQNKKKNNRLIRNHYFTFKCPVILLRSGTQYS